MLLALVVLFTICLIWQQKTGNRLFNWLVGLGAAYFGLHILLWGLNPDIYQESAILGTVYNTRLPAFLVLGYGAALLTPSKFVFRSLIKIALGVSTVVAFLGVLQYFLPRDLLTHFGYGLERGTRPAFFIDDNPEFPRIMSTLREPNALGAYLLLPFAALTLLFFKIRDNSQRLLLAAAVLLHASAILLTFSRSAWLGAALALGLVLWWSFRATVTAAFKRYWLVAAGLVVVLGGFSFLVRDTALFQHYIVHSDPTEQVADLDSNDYHTLLVKRGLGGIADEPQGHGPGTAGIVSIRNPDGGHLTENYYIQIGYEVGVLGLAVFAAINVLVYLRLRKRGDAVGWVLMAAFWAYFATNMLLHTWSNETVAAQWWLLAGVAVAGVGALRYNEKQ